MVLQKKKKKIFFSILNRQLGQHAPFPLPHPYFFFFFTVGEMQLQCLEAEKPSHGQKETKSHTSIDGMGEQDLVMYSQYDLLIFVKLKFLSSHRVGGCCLGGLCI